MPIYKDKKIKEIMRSILPSTGSKKAKFYKTNIRRKDRRNIRQALRSELGFIDDSDDSYIDESLDLKDDLQREVSYIVSERRGNDKVNHFIRWAKAKTKDIDDGSKLSAIRSISPKNIIGEHAVSHLENILEVKNPHAFNAVWRYNNNKTFNIYDYEWVFKFILTKDLRLLKLFNKMLVEKNNKKELTRTLKSIIDIKDFMDDIIRMRDSSIKKKVSFVRLTSKVIYAPKRTQDKDLKNLRERKIIHVENFRKKIVYYTHPERNPYPFLIAKDFIKIFIRRHADFQMIEKDIKKVFYDQYAINH